MSWKVLHWHTIQLWMNYLSKIKGLRRQTDHHPRTLLDNWKVNLKSAFLKLLNLMLIIFLIFKQLHLFIMISILFIQVYRIDVILQLSRLSVLEMIFFFNWSLKRIQRCFNAERKVHVVIEKVLCNNKINGALKLNSFTTVILLSPIEW